MSVSALVANGKMPNLWSVLICLPVPVFGSGPKEKCIPQLCPSRDLIVLPSSMPTGSQEGSISQL